MFGVSKKGVSIYLAIMIMFILLAIGLGISVIIVSQMKMIRGMVDSVIAFCAADTGIERILHEAKTCYRAGCPSPPCYPPEDTCASPCRPDCWGLLEDSTFPDNLDTDINYEVIHEHCPDFDGDEVITGCGDCAICPDTDLCIIAAHLGESPPSDPKFDFDGNGIIEFIPDLSLVALKVGTSCSGYNNFESTGEFRETRRAIEVTR
ncbi:hypothetical protein KJA16_01615 [Patescibacteria group bacterium]|nr:hypothetical protein [Patescibacteria group bacterium]